MEPFKQELQTELKGKIPSKKLTLLPSGFQRIGDVIVLRLDPALKPFEKSIGVVVLKQYRVKTVCAIEGKISGALRKPHVKKIAGDSTETTHKENGISYSLDVAKIVFAKGNINERARLPRLVKSGEIVADMFAGIGYFTLPIAKFSGAKKIYAIEKNPVAVRYLKENMRKNYISNVTPILGDNRKIEIPEPVDRVVMGYFPGTEKYLPAVFSFLKSGGVIHFHDVFSENDLWQRPEKILKKAAQHNGFTLTKILYKNIVKNYAPHKFHVVIDAAFEKA